MRCIAQKCKEAKMPKMLIKKKGKHFKKFSIKPNVKLRKHFTDWPKRIRAKVKGLKKGPDFDYNLKVKSNYFFP